MTTQLIEPVAFVGLEYAGKLLSYRVAVRGQPFLGVFNSLKVRRRALTDRFTLFLKLLRRFIQGIVEGGDKRLLPPYVSYFHSIVVHLTPWEGGHSEPDEREQNANLVGPVRVLTSSRGFTAFLELLPDRTRLLLSQAEFFEQSHR